ncbi:MFS transporter [Naumannella halotolerans]|uniref:UMF1 family MFS transporter n=1 Tax=Naumannella halotolerans TaxID=993414 RepID=A0A4R7JA28_9ACTN|nr:MFS transporter [Naumannella halotolerans]TDT33383.1 UMF1 family MFS transporter [Naumannella halotolerans]
MSPDPTPTAHQPVGDRPVPKYKIATWALWDWGSAAFNAVIVTFVFAPYVASSVAPADGPISGSEYIARAMAVTGLVVALIAPLMGQRSDARGTRRRSVAIWSGLTWLSMAALYLVEDTPDHLLLALVLLGVGNLFFELAEVNYFAMIGQISTPENVGRISGIGWAAGYFGGIVLLALLYFGLIAPDVGWFGVTSVDGQRYRMVALLAAGWFAIFGLPLLLTIERNTPPAGARALGLLDSYRKLFADLRRLWRSDRRAVWFLLAAAIYRDGLASVFTLGAVLAVSIYGLSEADVLIFGIVANVVAGVAALAGGWIEDRVGTKRVILIALGILVASATVLLFAAGPTMFWIFGLILCISVGPAQASSRSYLAQIAPRSAEGEMFGLYATSGRAVSLLGPGLFALIAAIASERFGILGIILLLVVGAAILWRLPNRPEETPAIAD